MTSNGKTKRHQMHMNGKAKVWTVIGGIVAIIGCTGMLGGKLFEIGSRTGVISTEVEELQEDQKETKHEIKEIRDCIRELEKTEQQHYESLTTQQNSNTLMLIEKMDELKK